MKRFCALLVLLGVDQALSVLNVVYCSCAVISKYDIGGTTATVNLTIYNTKGCNPGVVSTVLLELKL